MKMFSNEVEELSDEACLVANQAAELEHFLFSMPVFEGLTFLIPLSGSSILKLRV